MLSFFLSVSHTLPPAVRNASQFDRANDRYGANSTHNWHKSRLVRLLPMPNCFDKQAARHIYTHTHHVANLFRNIYTPTFSSSICVCSLSCILINHSPLYTHHTPAHTHTHARSAIPSSILLRIIIIIIIILFSFFFFYTTCYSLNGHTYIYISAVKSV
jgi:hypothetical protein